MVVATVLFDFVGSTRDTFQSLAGFLGRCDSVLFARMRPCSDKVSIPGGFSWSLRLYDRSRQNYRNHSFNPWRVFLVVATVSAPDMQPTHFGFNPWRVFLVVATRGGMRCISENTCFNPWRVFLVVATSESTGSLDQRRSFNPWRVFLVVATRFVHHLYIPVITVSIPGGFSWSLRRAPDGILADSAERVSIPGGFSWSLRHPDWSKFHIAAWDSFNPWRVFLVVATTPTGARPSRHCTTFQSLAGFLGRCDPSDNEKVLVTEAQFQSLAGFLGRCD